MERVGLLVLGIVSASALLLGASYGALYLPLLLLNVSTGWLAALAAIFVVVPSVWLGQHLLRRTCTLPH